MKGLLEKWREAWPSALAVWSRYTRLSEPLWSVSVAQDRKAGLTGSFAVIRINDHSVRVSLRQIRELGLDDYALEILAHEIGHHVFCPANLLEAGQALVLATRALPSVENQAPMIVNMWEDLLINDRLVRVHKQRHAEIYERINKRSKEEASPLWNLYMRAFEILWGLKKGRLCGAKLKAAQEGDAHLAARMVRVYGKDWMLGVGGFAALCLPYLLSRGQESRHLLLFDTDGLGEGCEVPIGILDLKDWDIVHPSRDPRVVGRGPGHSSNGEEGVSEPPKDGFSDLLGGRQGQNRQPYVFGQVLRALGLKLDSHQAAVKFYREKALPHLIPFPTQEVEQSQEPLMEGLEPWDVGNPMEEVDWLQSVLVSPHIVPGMTTVRRTWGVMGGSEREREPLDLDLYVDCSGSIPNPQTQLSFLALAGAVVVLSALRTGARVQATLWSGAGQFDKTPGFISDETAILRVLTGYLGGGTAFPKHVLRDTYAARKPSDRPVHILILSDEGVGTMAMNDERGTPGLQIARTALEQGRGGGTMVLNLYSDHFFQREFAVSVKEMGWELHRVQDWSELLKFAREFSRKKYGKQAQRR